MNRIRFLSFWTFVSIVLTGCGGGGGDGATTNASAEGFWSGPASTGFTVNLVILETGETWGIYSTGNTIYGALYGQTTTSGNVVSGTGTDFDLVNRTSTASSFSGSVSPKSSLSVRTASGTTFSGTYSATYDTAASLALLAGTFTGTAVTANTAPTTVQVTVSASGAITLPATNGCSATGTATPRPTGKNVFNISVTYSGTCALGNGTTTNGVGYYEASSKRLFGLALNTSKSDGFIFAGVKP